MSSYQQKSGCQPDQEFCVSNELRHGIQAATDLLGVIRQQKADLSSANVDSLRPAIGLVTRIIDSFSNSLSMLGRSQDLALIGGPRESSKSSSLSNGGRRCHKLRKGDSWTQVTSDILTADGYAWRKYGQKPILNAKHPRSYFKCTNKLNCQALKRVQKMDDDDPPMYMITHTGHHTCENPSSSSSFTDMDSSIFFNFEKENNEQSINFSGRLATLSSSSRRVKGSEECNNGQQSGLNPNSLPLLEHMETTKSINVEWSLDDYDYLIGSGELSDLHAF